MTTTTGTTSNDDDPDDDYSASTASASAAVRGSEGEGGDEELEVEEPRRRRDEESSPSAIGTGTAPDGGGDRYGSAASDLERDGVAQIRLDARQSEVASRAFAVGRVALDATSSSSPSSSGGGGGGVGVPMLDLNEDSYRCSGYHPPGGHLSGRYNAHREGFVFSDGTTFDLDLDLDDVPPSNENESDHQSFERATVELRTVLNGIAVDALRAVGGRLGLEDGYLESTLGGGGGGGGFGRCDQWHLKRYATSAAGITPNEEASSPEKPSQPLLLLPTHTDPSLVSVVLHDCPGINPGGWGLEYQSRSNTGQHRWEEISSHGHGVATVLVGSALGKLLQVSGVDSRRYPPARHRVVSVATAAGGGGVGSGGAGGTGGKYGRERVAATYFLRPDPGAPLRPLPLPHNIVVRVVDDDDEKPPVRFGEWYGRVSRRYGKSKVKIECEGKGDGAGGSDKGKAEGGVEAGENETAASPASKSSSFAPPPLSSRGDDDDDDDDDVGKTQDTGDDGGGIGGGHRHRDHHRGPECSLIYPSDPPLVGKEQYLGGELGDDGLIYAIPGHASRVMVIDPETDEVWRIGPIFEGKYKWLRSVKTSNGVIYGLPCHADSVLKIVPGTGEVSTIGGDNGSLGEVKGVPWKWHGGATSPIDGCIYAIPQFAERVLKIDPKTDEVSLVGRNFPGRNKWYGGLVGQTDGAIYGIPQNATGVLRIDPSSKDVVSVHGSFPLGGHKWHGGVVAPNGSIIGIPANADTVLKIIPGADMRISEIGGPETIRTGSHRVDGKYKFLGAVVGSDNLVYFMPSDADRVVQVDPNTDMVREVGPSLAAVGKSESVCLEPMRQNKWQNGFVARDGAIYAIPLKGQTVLRVETKTNLGELVGAKHLNASNDVRKLDRIRVDQEPVVSTIGGLYKGLNKWEGGVMAQNGVMYCMPLNHKAILRISPALASLS